MNKTIKINNWNELPNNFTGIVEHSTKTKFWFKEGKLHRTNGPAIVYPSGTKEWYLEGARYTIHNLQYLSQNCLYLGKKENGNHNLVWLSFLTDQGIKGFPIIPGMEEDNDFIPL